MDNPYQNRELDEKFQDIQQTLSRIETQTSKTNGRVNELEVKERVNRAKINTFIGVFSFMIAMVAIPIVSSLIQSGKI